jgi:hypothetical protein
MNEFDLAQQNGITCFGGRSSNSWNTKFLSRSLGPLSFPVTALAIVLIHLSNATHCCHYYFLRRVILYRNRHCRPSNFKT